MPVPDFQTIMLPLLQLMSDGNDRGIDECVGHLADQLGLTTEDREELLPSGRQPRFTNRVNWAVTHLYKAGLLDRTGRKRIQVTDRGRTVLQANPTRIDMALLRRFPEYRRFQPPPQQFRVDGQEAQPRSD